MNVIVKFVVGITRPHHLLCIQIIILTIQAKKINNNASGHENENYQIFTHIPKQQQHVAGHIRERAVRHVINIIDANGL